VKVFNAVVKQIIVKADFVFCRLRQKDNRYFRAAKFEIFGQGVNSTLKIIARPDVRIEDKSDGTIGEWNYL